jgi:hypothetical protein
VESLVLLTRNLANHSVALLFPGGDLLRGDAGLEAEEDLSFVSIARWVSVSTIQKVRLTDVVNWHFD